MSSPDDPQIALAAVAAALDKSRISIARDLVVSTILEVLGSHGELTSTQLSEHVGGPWASKIVPDQQIKQALILAEEAGLIERHEVGTQTRWVIRPGPAEAARRDRAAVAHLWKEFEEGVRVRVVDIARTRIKPGDLRRFARTLYEALTAGVIRPGAYSLDDKGPEDVRRRLELDPQAIHNYIRTKTRPQELGWAVSHVAEAVLDQTDPFGKEILDLLCVGALLRDIVLRKDTPDPNNFRGARVLFDTSVLIAMLRGGGTSQLVPELAAICRTLDIEMVVAEHSLEEHERIFIQAEGTLPRVEHRGLRGTPATLLENPVLKEFLSQDGEMTLSWSEYQAKFRDPRPRLKELGVNVRPHGNLSDEDRVMVEQAYELVRELGADPDGAATRSPTSARVDAESLAMVARWRKTRPSTYPMGWFVGRERLTGQAYKELVKDDLFPLTITPETLLHLLTATRRDSPSHVADVAKILSSEMQCTAFLAIATKYPPEEIASFMEVFNRKLTPKEVSFLTSLDNRIVYLPDGVQDSRATDEIQQWVRDFSGANAGRHDARARREARMRRARDENLAQNKSEREAAQDEISRLEDEIDDLKREVVLGKKRIERLRRAIVATTISATGLLGVVLVHLIAKLSGPPVALAYTSEAAASLLAVRYALDPNVSGMWLVTTEFSTFALAVIATLLTQILS